VRFGFFDSEGVKGDLVKLQDKSAEIFALLAGVLMIVLGFSDFFIGLSSFIIIIKLSFAIPFLTGYWAMRRWGWHQQIIQVMLLLGLLIASINYPNNEGFRGPTLYTIFIFSAVTAILIRGWQRFFWLGFTFLLYSLLFYGEISGWYVVDSQYSSLENLFWDHWITILWCGLFVFLGIYVLLKNYSIQNAALLKVQKEKDEALKKLEDLNLKKNQLLALLSHDLKSPVAVLQSTLEMVDQGLFDQDEVNLILGDLKNQSVHLNRILNNTLGWVMAEMDGTKAQKSPINVHELTEEIVDAMRVPAHRKGQQIVLQKLGENMVCDLEVNEVKIILKNLLDNAVKFTPTGENIEVKAQVSKEKIEWRIFNPGHPIPENLHGDIFEFKVKSSLGTRSEKGTGLGLPLCKKIADQLELSLGFEVDSDAGNIFFLEKDLSS
jgi:Signal transduction histidine kinase